MAIDGADREGDCTVGEREREREREFVGALKAS